MTILFRCKRYTYLVFIQHQQIRQIELVLDDAAEEQTLDTITFGFDTEDDALTYQKTHSLTSFMASDNVLKLKLGKNSPGPLFFSNEIAALEQIFYCSKWLGYRLIKKQNIERITLGDNWMDLVEDDKSISNQLIMTSKNLYGHDLFKLLHYSIYPLSAEVSTDKFGFNRLLLKLKTLETIDLNAIQITEENFKIITSNPYTISLAFIKTAEQALDYLQTLNKLGYIATLQFNTYKNQLVEITHHSEIANVFKRKLIDHTWELVILARSEQMILKIKHLFDKAPELDAKLSTSSAEYCIEIPAGTERELKIKTEMTKLILSKNELLSSYHGKVFLAEANSFEADPRASNNLAALLIPDNDNSSTINSKPLPPKVWHKQERQVPSLRTIQYRNFEPSHVNCITLKLYELRYSSITIDFKHDYSSIEKLQNKIDALKQQGLEANNLGVTSYPSGTSPHHFEWKGDISTLRVNLQKILAATENLEGPLPDWMENDILHYLDNHCESRMDFSM